MRFYSFVNGLYMNSLQYGLQTGHAISEMSLHQSHSYKEWAKNHKTIIILDALNHAGLQRAHGALAILCGHYNAKVKPEEGIPFVKFHEDEQSLGGIMTCVGVILPEHIYGRVEERNGLEWYKSPRERFAEWEEGINNNHAMVWSKEKMEDLLYCLIKTHNLAPR